ncbi:hypothetical protein ACFYTQ_28175 [Nocardia sp. NPDC004068]|uniref:hypothetical protein n=1 Tax=Nocardia sp. NPDC004068 TaxID=3364303 RepID=UPI0036A86FF6
MNLASGPHPHRDLDLDTGPAQWWADDDADARAALSEGRWLVAVASAPLAPHAPGRGRWRDAVAQRVPRRAWWALAAIVAVLVGVAAMVGHAGDPGTSGGATAVPPDTSRPPSSTGAVGEGPCTGLSGTVVTDRSGDPATVAGVIASFEAAYYVTRSAEAAMRLLAPESGIAADGLAAGIASIPPGTVHCVAITPISESTATVHIVELHPDRQRVDYLQLINTIPASGSAGLVISNIQRQG